MLFTCGGCEGIFNQPILTQPSAPTLRTINGAAWRVRTIVFEGSRTVLPRPASELLCLGCVTFLTIQLGRTCNVPEKTL